MCLLNWTPMLSFLMFSTGRSAAFTGIGKTTHSPFSFMYEMETTVGGWCGALAQYVTKTCWGGAVDSKTISDSSSTSSGKSVSSMVGVVSGVGCMGSKASVNGTCLENSEVTESSIIYNFGRWAQIRLVEFTCVGLRIDISNNFCELEDPTTTRAFKFTLLFRYLLKR